MLKTRQITVTSGLVLAGALLAAVAGARAGATLRPEQAERGAAAAPQQILLKPPELAAAERAGGGWPGRALAPPGSS